MSLSLKMRQHLLLGLPVAARQHLFPNVRYPLVRKLYVRRLSQRIQGKQLLPQQLHKHLRRLHFLLILLSSQLNSNNTIER